MFIGISLCFLVIGIYYRFKPSVTLLDIDLKTPDYEIQDRISKNKISSNLLFLNSFFFFLLFIESLK